MDEVVFCGESWPKHVSFGPALLNPFRSEVSPPSLAGKRRKTRRRALKAASILVSNHVLFVHDEVLVSDCRLCFLPSPMFEERLRLQQKAAGGVVRRLQSRVTEGDNHVQN